ncbi:MAG: dTMP kinase [Acidobacteriota bacterium]
MRGKLITFEGIDGCGKSSQLRLLSDYLTERKIPFVATREPGGTLLGQTVRSAILDSEPGTVEPLAELLLYAADRAQHVRRVIIPALESGRLVLSDRFFDATTAFQGYGRQFDLALIHHLNELATGGLKPDLTLLFDLEVKTALERVSARSRDAHPDRLDQEPMDFHERVRRGYVEIAALEPERIRVIPSHGSQEAIHHTVIEAVGPLAESTS